MARRLLTWMIRLLLAGGLAFAALVLLLRYLILPDIGNWRSDIERLAGNALGATVRIEKLGAGWDGLDPELDLDGVSIIDRRGQTALSFSHVEAVLSWRSFFLLRPGLRRLELSGTDLHAERRRDGSVWIAGMPADTSRTEESGVAAWLMRQEEVSVLNARVVWNDRQRGAPELVLEKLELRVKTAADRHLVALVAQPPTTLSGKLDFRAALAASGDGQQWRGDFYVDVAGVDFSVLRQWVDNPIDLVAGRGGMRLWGKVDDGKVNEVSADIALAGLDLRFDARLPRLVLDRMQGRLTWRRMANGDMQLAGQDLALTMPDNFAVTPTSFHLEWSPTAGSEKRGLAVVPAVDIGQLMHLLDYLPIDPDSRATLAGYAPDGKLSQLKLAWTGSIERLLAFTAEADFTDLSLQANGYLPGFSGLSGHLRADEKSGRLELASGPLTVELPAVFAATTAPIALDELQAKVDWSWQKAAGAGAARILQVNLQDVAFSGPDATGDVRGDYRFSGVGRGEINLNARIHEGNVAAAWRYVPKIVPQPVQDWMRTGLVGGTLRDGSVVLRGQLDKFPFRNDEGGQFLVGGHIDDGVVEYAAGWPKIEKLAADLRFAGSDMRITAQEGESAGAKLSKITVQLSDFSSLPLTLMVNGEASGRLENFTRFLDQSPVGHMLGRFYEEIRPGGSSRLELALAVPLDHPEATRVKGELEFLGNELAIDPLLPKVTEVSGRVGFTENGPLSSRLSGRFLGHPLQVDIANRKGEIRVKASGGATLTELRRHFGLRLFDQLAGNVPWTADVRVNRGRTTVSVESTLRGLVSTLPAPFAKTANVRLPVRFARTPLAAEPGDAGLRDRVDLRIGGLVDASFVRLTKGALPTIERGVIAVGTRQAMPSKGLRVVVRQDAIQGDLWRAALTGPRALGVAAAPPLAATGIGRDIAWPTPQLDLRAKSLQLFGRVFREVNLRATPMPGGMKGRLSTRDMAGDWDWESAGKGKFSARLKQLVLPDETTRAIGERATTIESEGPTDYPALDVVAEELVVGERRLGRVDVLAENAPEDNTWHIRRFGLSNADGEVEASGRWEPGDPGLTSVKFKLAASDLGRWLGRFGYADTVRRGKGGLDGEVSWRGTPMRLHPPTLSGNLRLKAEKGQFNKLEPGFGKLLALLSLQMLPRRVTLDFRDVFSEGFSFDRIDGNVAVQEGIMRTSNLLIEGPPARIVMKGEVDLGKETQKVRVTIQPEIGGPVALGAALMVNPVTGLAAYLAQKIMQDPLNKAFAFEYDITGAWHDPVIEKVGGGSKPATTPPGSPAQPTGTAP